MAKINIGDEVRYLNDVGGGRVVAVISKDQVMVLDSSGFEIPAMTNELVVIGPIRKNIATPEKKDDLLHEALIAETDFYPKGSLIPGRNEPKFYLAFVSQTAKYIETDNVEVYLINECNYNVFYHVMKSDAFHSEELKVGLLGANSKVLVAVFDKEKIFSLSAFILQLIFYKKDKYAVIKPWENYVRIDQIGIERESMFRKNIFFDNPALILPISDRVVKEELTTQIEDTFSENQGVLKEKLRTDIEIHPVSKTKPESMREIDLHIHNLIDSTTGLTPKEMLDIQMTHFHIELNRAIKDHVKRIVFIHGLGNGTLKNELRSVLEQEYGKYTYHDASFKEYGFGATLVILNNN